jgi:hypothetical protein
VSITEQQEHRGVFFIFVSREIASDYKRLVRSGDADWVSLEGAPQEILDIVSRTKRSTLRPPCEHARPTFVALYRAAAGRVTPPWRLRPPYRPSSPRSRNPSSLPAGS